MKKYPQVCTAVRQTVWWFSLTHVIVLVLTVSSVRLIVQGCVDTVFSCIDGLRVS